MESGLAAQPRLEEDDGAVHDCGVKEDSKQQVVDKLDMFNIGQYIDRKEHTVTKEIDVLKISKIGLLQHCYSTTRAVEHDQSTGNIIIDNLVDKSNVDAITDNLVDKSNVDAIIDDCQVYASVSSTEDKIRLVTDMKRDQCNNKEDENLDKEHDTLKSNKCDTSSSLTSIQHVHNNDKNNQVVHVQELDNNKRFLVSNELHPSRTSDVEDITNSATNNDELCIPFLNDMREATSSRIPFANKCESSATNDDEEEDMKFCLSNRSLHTRKTIELDKDKSEMKVKHTSCLCFNVGSEQGCRVPLMTSEVNIVWGKTVDTDQINSPSSSETGFRSELEFIPFLNRSIDDFTDYWSADMSSDTIITSDANDHFVESGDSLYASDFNDSFIDQTQKYVDVSDSHDSDTLQRDTSDSFSQTSNILKHSVISNSDCVFSNDKHPKQKAVIVSENKLEFRKTCDSESTGKLQQGISQLDTDEIQEQLEASHHVDRKLLYKVSSDIAKLGLGVKDDSSVKENHQLNSQKDSDSKGFDIESYHFTDSDNDLSRKLKDNDEPRIKDNNEPRIDDNTEPQIEDNNEPQIKDNIEPQMEDNIEPQMKDNNKPRIEDKNALQIDDNKDFQNVECKDGSGYQDTPDRGCKHVGEFIRLEDNSDRLLQSQEDILDITVAACADFTINKDADLFSLGTCDGNSVYLNVAAEDENNSNSNDVEESSTDFDEVRLPCFPRPSTEKLQQRVGQSDSSVRFDSDLNISHSIIREDISNIVLEEIASEQCAEDTEDQDDEKRLQMYMTTSQTEKNDFKYINNNNNENYSKININSENVNLVIVDRACCDQGDYDVTGALSDDTLNITKQVLPLVHPKYDSKSSGKPDSDTLLQLGKIISQDLHANKDGNSVSKLNFNLFKTTLSRGGTTEECVSINDDAVRDNTHTEADDAVRNKTHTETDDAVRDNTHTEADDAVRDNTRTETDDDVLDNTHTENDDTVGQKASHEIAPTTFVDRSEQMAHIYANSIVQRRVHDPGTTSAAVSNNNLANIQQMDKPNAELSVPIVEETSRETNEAVRSVVEDNEGFILVMSRKKKKKKKDQVMKKQQLLDINTSIHSVNEVRSRDIREIDHKQSDSSDYDHVQTSSLNLMLPHSNHVKEQIKLIKCESPHFNTEIDGQNMISYPICAQVLDVDDKSEHASTMKTSGSLYDCDKSVDQTDLATIETASRNEEHALDEQLVTGEIHEVLDNNIVETVTDSTDRKITDYLEEYNVSTMSAVGDRAQTSQSFLTSERDSVETSQSFLTSEPGSVETIQSFLTDERGDVETIQSFLTDERGDVETIQSVLTDERGDVETIQSVLTGERCSVESIQNVLTSERDSVETSQSFLTSEPDSVETSQSFLTSEPGSVETSQSFFTSEPDSVETSQSFLTSEPDSVETSQSFLTSEPGSVETSQSFFTSEPDSVETSQSFLTSEPDSVETSQSFLTSEPDSVETSQSFLTSEPGSVETSQSFLTSERGSVETSQSFLTSEPDSVETSQSFLTSEPDSVETSQSFLTSEPDSVETSQSFLTSEPGSVETSQSFFTSEPDSVETSQSFLTSEPDSVETSQSFLTSEPGSVETSQSSFTSEPDSVETSQSFLTSEPDSVETSQSFLTSEPGSVETSQSFLPGQQETLQNENFVCENQSKTIEEKINTEEFMSRILEGTDVLSLEHTHEFLHSDESGGILLNMYTGGHRRILKPHRRFSKPHSEINSKTDGHEMSSPIIRDSYLYLEETTNRTISVETPLNDTLNTSSDLDEMNKNVQEKVKESDKSHKRKRIPQKQNVDTLPDSICSEINISGVSSSGDVIFEELKDIGDIFDMFIYSPTRKGLNSLSMDSSLGEPCGLSQELNKADVYGSVDECDTIDCSLSDELNKIELYVSSEEDNTEYASTEIGSRGGSYVLKNSKKVISNIEKLQPQSDNISTDKIEMQSECDNICTDKRELQSETDNISTDKIEMQSECDNICTDKRELQPESNNISTDKRDLQSETDNISTDKRELQSETDNISTDKIEMQSECDNICTDKRELQSEYNNISTDRRDLQSETANISTDKRELQESDNISTDRELQTKSDSFVVSNEELQRKLITQSPVDTENASKRSGDDHIEICTADTSSVGGDISTKVGEQLFLERSESFIDAFDLAEITFRKLVGKHKEQLPGHVDNDMTIIKESDLSFGQVEDFNDQIYENGVNKPGDNSIVFSNEMFTFEQKTEVDVADRITSVQEECEASKLTYEVIPHNNEYFSDENYENILLDITANINELLNDTQDETKDKEEEVAEQRREEDKGIGKHIRQIKFKRKDNIDNDDYDGDDESWPEDVASFQKMGFPWRVDYGKGRLTGNGIEYSMAVNLVESVTDLDNSEYVIRLNDARNSLDLTVDDANCDRKRNVDAVTDILYQRTDNLIKTETNDNVDQNKKEQMFLIKDGDLEWKETEESHECTRQAHADEEENDDYADNNQHSRQESLVFERKEWKTQEISNVKLESKDEYEDKEEDCVKVDNTVNKIKDFNGKNSEWKFDDLNDVKCDSDNNNEDRKDENKDTCVDIGESKIGEKREYFKTDDITMAGDGIDDVKWERNEEDENRKHEEKDKDEKREVEIIDYLKIDDITMTVNDIDDVKWERDGGDEEENNCYVEDKRMNIETRSITNIEDNSKTEDVTWRIEDVGDIRWKSDAGDEVGFYKPLDKTQEEKRDGSEADNLEWKIDDIVDVKWESDDEEMVDIKREFKDMATVVTAEDVETDNSDGKIDDIGDVKWESDDEDEDEMVDTKSGVKDMATVVASEDVGTDIVIDNSAWKVDDICDVKWESDDEDEEDEEEMVDTKSGVKDMATVVAADDVGTDIGTDNSAWKVDDIGDVKWENDDEDEEEMVDTKSGVKDMATVVASEDVKTDNSAWKVDDIGDVKWESDDEDEEEMVDTKSGVKDMATVVAAEDVEMDNSAWKVDDICDVKWESDDEDEEDEEEMVDTKSGVKDMATVVASDDVGTDIGIDNSAWKVDDIGDVKWESDDEDEEEMVDTKPGLKDMGTVVTAEDVGTDNSDGKIDDIGHVKWENDEEDEEEMVDTKSGVKDMATVAAAEDVGTDNSEWKVDDIDHGKWESDDEDKDVEIMVDTKRGLKDMGTVVAVDDVGTDNSEWKVDDMGDVKWESDDEEMVDTKSGVKDMATVVAADDVGTDIGIDNSAWKVDDIGDVKWESDDEDEERMVDTKSGVKDMGTVVASEDVETDNSDGKVDDIGDIKWENDDEDEEEMVDTKSGVKGMGTVVASEDVGTDNSELKVDDIDDIEWESDDNDDDQGIVDTKSGVKDMATVAAAEDVWTDNSEWKVDDIGHVKWESDDDNRKDCNDDACLKAKMVLEVGKRDEFKIDDVIWKVDDSDDEDAGSKADQRDKTQDKQNYEKGHEIREIVKTRECESIIDNIGNGKYNGDEQEKYSKEMQDVQEGDRNYDELNYTGREDKDGDRNYDELNYTGREDKDGDRNYDELNYTGREGKDGDRNYDELNYTGREDKDGDRNYDELNYTGREGIKGDRNYDELNYTGREDKDGDRNYDELNYTGREDKDGDRNYDELNYTGREDKDGDRNYDELNYTGREGKDGDKHVINYSELTLLENTEAHEPYKNITAQEKVSLNKEFTADVQMQVDRQESFVRTKAQDVFRFTGHEMSLLMSKPSHISQNNVITIGQSEIAVDALRAAAPTTSILRSDSGDVVMTAGQSEVALDAIQTAASTTSILRSDSGDVVMTAGQSEVALDAIQTAASTTSILRSDSGDVVLTAGQSEVALDAIQTAASTTSILRSDSGDVVMTAGQSEVALDAIQTAASTTSILRSDSGDVVMTTGQSEVALDALQIAASTTYIQRAVRSDFVMTSGQSDVALNTQHIPTPADSLLRQDRVHSDSTTEAYIPTVSDKFTIITLPKELSTLTTTSESESIHLAEVRPEQMKPETKRKNKKKKNRKKNIKSLALEQTVNVMQPLSGIAKRAVGDTKGVGSIDEKHMLEIGRGDSYLSEAIREQTDFLTVVHNLECQDQQFVQDLHCNKTEEDQQFVQDLHCNKIEEDQQFVQDLHCNNTEEDNKKVICTEMSHNSSNVQDIESTQNNLGRDRTEIERKGDNNNKHVEIQQKGLNTDADIGKHFNVNGRVVGEQGRIHPVTMDNVDISLSYVRLVDNFEAQSVPAGKNVDNGIDESTQVAVCADISIDESTMSDGTDKSLVIGRFSSDKNNETRNVNVMDNSVNVDRPDKTVPSFYVDRHEELILECPKQTICKRLLEDVVRNKDRAEQLVAQNPEASQRQIIRDSKSTSDEPTLTPAGHLLSEMALLETSARDQWETLELAVSQHERFQTEIQCLNEAIEEAQKKLQSSSVTATSVGALKQQISERNNLTEQIKNYHIMVNEITEQSRQLALDSAQLSPSVFRKHYHPDSAYLDYFAATSQLKRGASPLPVSGNLFYENLPMFDYPSSSDQESLPISTRDPKQRLEPWKPIERPTTGGFSPISLELPRKIPPPRTDSIPRPTWSEDISSSSALASDMSRNTSTSHSLDSPRTMAMAGETSASSQRSMDSRYALTKQSGQPFISTRATEVGPQISRSSLDSGLGTDSNEHTLNTSQFHTDTNSSISSLADKLLSGSDPASKRAPLGGHPTEILRMRTVDQDDMSKSAFENSLKSSSDINAMSSESPHFESVSAISTPLTDKVSPMELQAIQKQESYKQKVLDLIDKIESAKVKLANNPSQNAASLETVMKEYKETLAEVNIIKNDLTNLKDFNDQLKHTHDSDVHTATDSMLAMVVDKYNSLEVMATEQGVHLQNKEDHVVAVEVCKKKIKDLQNWLKDTKAYQASHPFSLDDSGQLQAQLEDNQDIQEQINSKMQALSTLKLQWNNLCMNEKPISVEKVHNDLKEFQRDLEQLNLDTVNKQVQLQTAIANSSEHRRWETEDITPSVQRLQNLEFSQDIREHRQLVSQLADQGRHLKMPSTEMMTSDKEIRDSWERLSSSLTQKKDDLDTILRTKQPTDLAKITMHAPASYTESTRQLEDIKSAVRALSDSWNQEQQLRPDEMLMFQQQYQSVLQNISSLMDTTEQQMFIRPRTMEEQTRHNENMKRQIKSLQGELATMNELAEDLLTSANSSDRDIIGKCLKSTNERAQLMEKTIQSQTENIHQTDRQWKQYEQEVVTLQAQLQDTQNIMLASASIQSMDQLLSDNQKIETQLKQCESDLKELKRKESSLTQGYPKGVFLSEIATLESKYMELHKKALDKKSTLNNLVMVQDQYQNMLKDSADFLDTAQDKLRIESISARDLNHLKQQLADHKNFFSDLEVHKALLDSLARHCDPSTRTQFQQQHSSLNSLVHVLEDQASLHGQRLERLTHQWSELEDKLLTTQKVLSTLESQMPPKIDSGDSVATIQDKLNKCKRLQLELADKRNAVFEVVEKGKQILHSINCPTMETAITDLANKWVSLNSDLTNELLRTETLGDQLSVFETEAAVLSSWLITAKMKLASFKHLSTSRLNNIGAVRNEVEKVLEFRKEVENQVALKNRIILVGNQLMQNKNYDTKGFVSRLKDYEEEWTQLEKGIVETQEYLHQVQMELMPSRQTLNELIEWTDEISRSLEKDASRMSKSMVDIKIMVKKYKGYKIELASRQMSLDFVNQQVLAPLLGELEVSKEKLEFADKLEALNQKWKKVVKEVNNKLNTLEGVHTKWEEYDKSLEKLNVWFHEQEDKIKHYHLIGNQIGVKQTLKDCKTLQQQLQDKQIEITSAKSLGNYLYGLSQESPKVQQSIKDSMSTLDQSWKRLEEKTRQLQSVLTDMLGCWERYHSSLDNVNHLLTQTEYSLNNCTHVTGDIDTLRSQLMKLKNLHADLNKNSGQFESFSALASQLRQVCEPHVKVEIQKTVSEVQTRWKKLNTDLAIKCNEFEHCLNEWEQFENECNKIKDWLNTKESVCTDLISTNNDSLKRPESLTKCKELQQELDTFTTQVSDLYRISDRLMKNMNPSTISIVMSPRSAIEQKILSLKETLSQFSNRLSNDISTHAKFNDIFKAVEKFLNYAENILANDDPAKTAEEKDINSRLNQLKELLLEFITNFEKLDAVNDLGYRLALNDVDAIRLKELNHKWYRLYEDARDRSRALQTNLLKHQNFTSKCESWMTFLAQTEQSLAEVMKGNLNDFSNQLMKCEQFESEMYSREQILHAIISDGQKMLNAGEVENKDEFQRKLRLLSVQWQNVSRRVSERKAEIEEATKQWQQFNALSQQLSQWLKDKENFLTEFEFDSNSLHTIRSFIEKVQDIKQEFKLNESMFKKIQELGNTFLKHADDKAATEIKDTLSSIQRDWYKVLRALDDSRLQFEKIDHQWTDCESEIEDMIGKLKDIRSILSADIPTTYDALQLDMSRCRDIENDFTKSEDKKQRLLVAEKQLGRVVQTSDMNLLHQRIQLLNKQREELQHQTHLREERITDALFRWNNLGDRMQSLIDWIEDMTIKVVSNRDIHVEDLLAKLENEYRQELEVKEQEKAVVVEQGMQLLKVSSDIRASVIAEKLHCLEDKWKHLKGVIDFRQRKLRETVLAVKQLETSMKNLSRWLSTVEAELSEGIMFKSIGLTEMRSKLQDSQELQQDIERHRAGVSAVLNLCEVLLHDSDACPTESEFITLQHTMNNLEKRWLNICSISLREVLVEETWQLWETFRYDCDRFSEWMIQVEREVGDSEIEVPNIKTAKASITKYEDLQRNIHDHLSDLEHINRQYCRLAKEGCTDADGSRKVMLTALNNRWDSLQLRVTEIMKKLRHSSSIREDFDATLLSLTTWLTEVDTQLINLQHPTKLDLQTKLAEIRRIEDEVHTKRYRMKYLDQAGVYLIQKGDSQEALRVQRELDEFRAFCKMVLGRVVTTQLQIEHMALAEADDISTKYSSEDRHYQLAADQQRKLQNIQTSYNNKKQASDQQKYLKESSLESPPAMHRSNAYSIRRSMSPLRVVPSLASRDESKYQRSESPSYLRSRSPTQKTIRSASPQAKNVRRQNTSHLSRDVMDGKRYDITSLERSAKIDVLMEQLVESINDCNVKFARFEKSLEPSFGAEQSVRSLVECETAVDDVQRLDRLLKTETGLTAIESVDAQVKFVLRRWEQLQRRVKECDVRLSQERYDLVQYGNDIESMLAWLDEAEVFQSAHNYLPSDDSDLDLMAREYKNFLEQVESKKPNVLSINMRGEKYIGTKSARARQLGGKLQNMNRRWELILSWVAEVQRDLQMPQIEYQELLLTIDDYHLWVENIETKIRHCEPINLSANESALWEKYSRLGELHADIIHNEEKVLELKETADWLLRNTDGSEMSTARDKIYIVHKRMQSLQHLASAYITSLENKLLTSSRKGTDVDHFNMSEGDLQDLEVLIHPDHLPLCSPDLCPR